MLHNGFIHLSKPRLGSAPPEIIPHSPLPPEWELSLAPGIIGSLSIIVLIILHGNLFAQAFVFPTVFLAGWDSALHIFEGDGRLSAESFSNLIRQVENSRAKKHCHQQRGFQWVFSPNSHHCSFCPVSF